MINDKVHLVIVSLGKYNDFTHAFMESVHKYFFADSRIHVWHITDKLYNYDCSGNHLGENARMAYTPIYMPMVPWPLPTLLRYHMLTHLIPHVKDGDYVVYSDIDMVFVKPIGEEILSARTAVKHFAYLGTPAETILTHLFELNPVSSAFVDPMWKATYHCGGFWCVDKENFLDLETKMIRGVNNDLAQHFIAKWHDESHFNRWLHENPPELTLPTNFILQAGCGREGNTILDFAGNVNYKDWRSYTYE